MYQGDAYRNNLGVVRELGQFAADDLGISIGQLAIAWVLANSAVNVAIVGTSRSEHLDEAIAATNVGLGPSALERIDTLVRTAVIGPGPTPESTPRS